MQFKSYYLCFFPLVISSPVLADASLYSQDENCFEQAQSIYDSCLKKMKDTGGDIDEYHHACLSKYHTKIDSCLVPE